MNEIEKFEPEIIKFCRNSLQEHDKEFDFQRIDKESFKKCPSISIDYAVMEKTSLGTVLPLDAGWSDLGSWRAIYDSAEKNEKEMQCRKSNVKRIHRLLFSK